MQVEAIYDHGRLEFVHPLQLKHDNVRLVVVVPDEEIISAPCNPNNLPKELLEQGQAMLAKLEAIRNAPLPPDDELAELTPKQLQHIEAFDLRAQLRAEQGRPI